MVFLTMGLTGVIYPLIVTSIAQVVFPWAANGSLVRDDKGRVVGSEVIGQRFVSMHYFHSRPSASIGVGSELVSSGGSNLGPSSTILRERAKADADRLRAENPIPSGEIPADLVTASASGLDPHLSLDGALWQVARVAKARSVASERIRALVQSQVEEPTLGFLGERRVNVFLLNRALDLQFGRLADAAPR